MGKIKKIKILLEIGDKEIKNDQYDIETFIGQLNNIYEDANIYFQLLTSDDKIKDSDIENSEIFLIMFDKNMDESVKKSFNKAYQVFHESHKNPRIFTFFKNIEEKSRKDGVLQFMQTLDKELQHFYDYYDSIDTIKLKLILQLQSLNLVEIKFETKDNKMFLGENEILSLENIPMFFNNEQLTSLKKEYLEVKKKRDIIKKKYDKDPDNQEVFDELMDVSKKCQDYKNNISELENSILSLEKSFVEGEGRDELSDRQIQARALLNHGDLKGALEVLSYKVLKKDEDNLFDQIDFMKDKAKVLINEYVQRAETLLVDISNKKRFAEAKQAYEEAILIEQKSGLVTDVLHKYASYLYDQGELYKALEHEQEYVHLLEENKREVSYSIYAQLGQYNHALGKYNEAIEFFNKALEKTNADNESYIAFLYFSLGTTYSNMNSFDKSLKYFFKAVDIYKKIGIEDSSTYNNIGVLYNDMGDGKNAIVYYQKALDAAIKNNKEGISTNYLNLASQYTDLCLYDKAEEYYFKSLEYTKKLVKDNPNKYVFDMLDIYRRIMLFYYFKEQYDKSSEYCDRILKIIEKTVRHEKEYMNDFIFIYNHLGVFYDNVKNDYDNAILYYNKGLELALLGSKEYPDKYLSDIGLAYNNLAIVYEKLYDYDKAIEYANKALDVRLKHADGGVYSEINDIIDSYGVIADIYCTIGDNNKAISYYMKSIDIVKKYLKNNKNFEELLVDLYFKIIDFYDDISKNDEVISYCDLILEVLDNYFDKDSLKYNHYYADVYYHYGRAKNELKLYEEAVSYFKKSIDVYLGDKRNNYNAILQEISYVYQNMGYSYLNLDKKDDALINYDKCLEIRKKLVKDSPKIYYKDLYYIYKKYAEYYKKFEEIDKAKSYYKDIIKELQNVTFDSRELLAYAHVGFSYFYKSLKEYDNYLEEVKKSVEIYKELMNENEIKYIKDVASSYEDLGDAYSCLQKYEDAINNYESSLELYEKVSYNDFYIAKEYHNIAYNYRELKEYDKALEYAKKSFSIKKKLYEEKGEKYLDNLIRIYNLISSIYYKYLNNKEAALPYYLEVVKIKTNEEAIADNYYNIGDIYYLRKDYNEAMKYFLKIIDIRKKKDDDANKRKLVDTYRYLSMCYSCLNDNDKMIEYAMKAYKLSADISYSVAWYGLCLGRAYDKIHDFDNAIKYGLEAIDSYKNGDNHSGEFDACCFVSIVYLNNKKIEDGEKYCKRAIDIYEKFKIEGNDLLYSYASALCNLGYAYGKKKDYRTGLSYEEKAIEVAEGAVDKDESFMDALNMSYRNATVFCRKLHQFKKTFEYAKKVVELTQKMKNQ